MTFLLLEEAHQDTSNAWDVAWSSPPLHFPSTPVFPLYCLLCQRNPKSY